MKNNSKIEYDGLLASGMFFEFYPKLTGKYISDKKQWDIEYKKLLKTRKDYAKRTISN